MLWKHKKNVVISINHCIICLENKTYFQKPENIFFLIWGSYFFANIKELNTFKSSTFCCWVIHELLLVPVFPIKWQHEVLFWLKDKRKRWTVKKKKRKICTMWSHSAHWKILVTPNSTKPTSCHSLLQPQLWFQQSDHSTLHHVKIIQLYFIGLLLALILFAFCFQICLFYRYIKVLS